MKTLKALAILGLTLAALELPAHASIYNTAEQNSMEHYFEINRQMNAEVVPRYLEANSKLAAANEAADPEQFKTLQQDFWRNSAIYNGMHNEMSALSDTVSKSLRARALKLPHVAKFLARFQKQKPVIESVALSVVPDEAHMIPQIKANVYISGVFKASKRRSVKNCDDKRELVHRSFSIEISADTGEIVKNGTGTGFYPTTDCAAD